MEALLLLPFLLMPFPPGQNPVSSEQPASVTVLSFKWFKARQAGEKPELPVTGPAPAMIPANKNYERNARANAPAGVRDPNLDTVDGRSAAMEKAVQESRAPQPKSVDGFAYRTKIQNVSTRIIEIVFWEYQFADPSSPTTISRRQFLCGVNIKPGKEKELQAFSVSGPSDVINVGTLARKSQNPFLEKVVINRVEFADGSIWQRKDWNFGEVRLTYASALRTPWEPDMCKGL